MTRDELEKRLKKVRFEVVKKLFPTCFGTLGIRRGHRHRLFARQRQTSIIFYWSGGIMRQRLFFILMLNSGKRE
jgi:hypothetical protein